MNIVDELNVANSKPVSLKVATYVGADVSRFKKLMQLVLGDNFELAQRASWAMEFCYEAHPFLLKPYVDDLLRLMSRKDCHDAVHRNSAKILETMDLNEEQQSIAWDIGIQLLQKMETKVAVKAYLMFILAKIAKEYEELAAELLAIIEMQYPYSSPGFKARAKKVYKMLGKQI